MNTDRPAPLTNKHLRAMAWAAFGAAIILAIWGAASDTVIMAFLTKAAADLGLVQARNSVEEVVQGRDNSADSRVDVSQI